MKVPLLSVLVVIVVLLLKFDMKKIQ